MSHRYAFRTAIKLPTAAITSATVDAALVTIQSCALDREDLSIEPIRIDSKHSLVQIHFEGKLVSPDRVMIIDSAFEHLGHCAAEAFAVERPNRDDLPTQFFGPDDTSIRLTRRDYVASTIKAAIEANAELLSSLSSDQQGCLSELGEVIADTIHGRNRGTLVVGSTRDSSPEEPDGFVDQFDEPCSEVRNQLEGIDSPYEGAEPFLFLDRWDVIQLLRRLPDGADNAYTQRVDTESAVA